MYVINSLQIRPELDQYRTHIWRPMRELIVAIRTLDNCDFLKAEGRAQAKRQLDASYGSRVSTRAFDINLRFSARITLVNITLEPYPTIINSMYVLLQNGDESNPETCERLAPHYYALIREFKRLLEARLGAYSRERFESEFRLEWRE
ncbi:hypothetical protein FB192DRAFT_1347767 [Mucor lusitanicus]|uniref:Uncharacterized protein n=1 Tax=Mucor circinelloides f. lusitanicus TaxID=29924 RepID=A0A8H4B674_MUCCL|nr:hypothetical protein FB192DRAFT_1347767 [Mucor lusitanicus]